MALEVTENLTPMCKVVSPCSQQCPFSDIFMFVAAALHRVKIVCFDL